MAKKSGSWLSRNLYEIRETLFTPDPNDSSFKKNQKAVGWYMFLILMVCGGLAMLIAVSFVH
jgi:hypothetical protein